MKNILCHEFFKLRRNKALWICSAIAFLIVVLFAGLGASIPDEGDYKPQGNYGLIDAAKNVQTWSLLLAVVVCSIIVNEYGRGIMRNILMCGQPRYKVYFSKLIICTLVALFIFTIFYGTDTLMLTLINGFGSVNIGRYLLILLVVFLHVIAIAAVIMFFADLTQNTGATIGITIGLTIVFILLSAFGGEYSLVSKSLTQIGQLYVGNTINMVANYELGTAKMVRYAVTAIVTTILFTAAGLFLFKKREFK